MRLAFASLLLLAGCSGWEPDRLLPGPCRADEHASGIDRAADYGYDADGHLVSFAFGTDDGVETDQVEWTWNGDTLERMRWRESCDVCPITDSLWTFEAGGATRTESGDEVYTEQYEAELRFVGHRHAMDDLRRPEAPDSLLSHVADVVNVTYTYSGPPRTGTRTRTGSDGSVTTFDYDADGNLLEWSDADRTFTYRYEGGRLVEQRLDALGPTHYEYDGFGNLTRTVVEGGAATVYDYSCWE